MENEEFLFVGTPICRGIAIGRPFFFTLANKRASEVQITPQQIDSEIVKYRCAVIKTKEEIKLLRKYLDKERALDAIEILNAHLQMMEDPLLTSSIETEIRRSEKNAAYVFQEVIQGYQDKFDSIADAFFRERFKDIQEISQRILSHLNEEAKESLGNAPHDAIVFATDLTTLDTARASGHHIQAFVTRDGGETSHAAIIAKAKGIPYISSINLEEISSFKNSTVIVDGRTGKIIFNPSPITLEKYRHLKLQLSTHLQKLKGIEKLPAETYDGHRICLSANIETLTDIEQMHEYGASGVGLLRTESLFLSGHVFPSEEEQFTLYAQFIRNMKGLPIVIRTFDFGGDKMPQSPFKDCANPFLGCRAIRLMLKEKTAFKTQLRAILRASVYGKISILFPMITALSELTQAKSILKEAQKELVAEGINISDHTPIPIGCMIEVPSAAIIADLLAKECDFFSIGTNDLVQYALAVDRGNGNLTELYTPAHPSVIRLIKLVISEANHHGISVSVCGEVAADPRFTPLFVGLGVHALSIAPRYLTTVKNAIRNISVIDASRITEKILAQTSAREIEEILNREYQLSVPDDFFYNC